MNTSRERNETEPALGKEIRVANRWLWEVQTHNVDKICVTWGITQPCIRNPLIDQKLSAVIHRMSLNHASDWQSTILFTYNIRCPLALYCLIFQCVTMSNLQEHLFCTILAVFTSNYFGSAAWSPFFQPVTRGNLLTSLWATAIKIWKENRMLFSYSFFWPVTPAGFHVFMVDCDSPGCIFCISSKKLSLKLLMHL